MKKVYEFSTSGWYDEEESGRKPNTIRLLDADEKEMLTSDLLIGNDRSTIRIAYNEKIGFERTITAAYDIGRILGKHLMMFCWDPREGRDDA